MNQKLGNRIDAIKALRAQRALRRWVEAEMKVWTQDKWDDKFGFTETYEPSKEMVAVGDMVQIGSGSFRGCWTVDGEVAYKIGHYASGWQDNMEEWQRYRRYAHIMPKGTRLPKMHAYSFEGNLILAVEIIHYKDPETLPPKQYDNIPDRNWSRLPFPFYDHHSGNWRWDWRKREFVILDFA
jgi:hypothetical protein